MFSNSGELKRILLFGAGKSATSLIDYLIQNLSTHQWELIVADGNLKLAQDKIGNAEGTFAVGVDVQNDSQRNVLIQGADIVISMLPPALHFLVAKDCVEFGKNLLTASYVDDHIRSLQNEIHNKGLLFLCEMGLDPGIDHMSAMQIIHNIRNEGGKIHTFYSHCGGLVAPESDDNPWHYKISWNPRNIILAGKAGATFKENGEVKFLPYEDLFDPYRQVKIQELGNFAWYPNRDSLGYMPLYQLEDSVNFVRTTLRHPDFCLGWKNVVQLKLTDETVQYDTEGLTLRNFFKLHFETHGFSDWLKNNLNARFNMVKDLLEKTTDLIEAEDQAKQFAQQEGLEFDPNMLFVNKTGELKDINLEELKNDAQSAVIQKMHEANLSLKLLFYLGLDSDEPINKGKCCAADVLQFVAEKRMALGPADKDMIVMLHQFGYSLNGKNYLIDSSLVAKGNDQVHTAMAKTVGLPLGIATKLILEDKITIKGLHIPVLPEIYEPVLKELEILGIRFKENKIEL